MALADAKQLRYRAHALRDQANLFSPQNRATLLTVADDYDRIAATVEQNIAEAEKWQSLRKRSNPLPQFG